MRETGKKKKRISVLAALCFVTVLALLLSTAGVTLAKYIAESGGDGAAVAKPFYFSSDKLAEDMPYYQIDEPDGEETVTVSFTLSNFVDKLRRTEGTVRYTYRAVSGAEPSAAPITGTEGTGEFQGTGFETAPEIVLNLKRADFDADGVVTVVASATSPYEKTISAQFGFTARQHLLQWVVTEQDNAMVLELAGGDGRNVTVSWPDTLSPDLSNSVFEGAASGTVTFAAEAGARYALTFFKSDPEGVYTEADFSVRAAGS